MKTKPTIEQWKEAANLILLAERSLSDLFNHPVIRNSKSTRRDQVRKAIQTLSKLRSDLDSDVCNAFPEADHSIVRVFYPGAGNYHKIADDSPSPDTAGNGTPSHQEPVKDEAWFF